jgi:16S rRNA C967 or C1407 C5-methylase (RsmB/RsmF family)
MLLVVLLFSLSTISSCRNIFEHNQQVFAADMTNPEPLKSSSQGAFEHRFATEYGQRWHSTLLPALKSEPRHAALYNRYSPLKDFHHVVGPPHSLERVHFPSTQGDIQADNLLCFTRKQDYESGTATIPAAEKASNGLLTHSNVDAASILATHILQVVPGDNVLDLCAGQGGNSITLAQPIWPSLYPDSTLPPMMGAKKGALHSNELDHDRDHSLAETLAQSLPASLISAGQQRVIHVDATQGAKDLPFGPGGYDKVLVDAPSSDERRVVQAQSKATPGTTTRELKRWDVFSAKDVAEVQVQILVTALKAVRVGGRVVYSTRSISDEENDGVVEKAIALIEEEEEAKKGITLWTAEVEPLDGEVERRLEADWAEKTGKGWLVLPDHAGGGKWGPLYFSVLTKKSST